MTMTSAISCTRTTPARPRDAEQGKRKQHDDRQGQTDIGGHAPTAAGAGEDFSVSQAGITITRLRAACGEREYLLERRNPFRRERRIVARRSGAEVASTAPEGNGLQVSVGELPELDAIFLSYACALLDATPRTLRT